MLGTIAWADPAVLPDVPIDHALRKARPSRISVNVMVGTDARYAWMLAAASSRSARDNAADRAELHRSRRRSAQVGAGDVVARLTLVTLDCRLVDISSSVHAAAGAVYSPTVLRLRGQPQ